MENLISTGVTPTPTLGIFASDYGTISNSYNIFITNDNDNEVPTVVYNHSYILDGIRFFNQTKRNEDLLVETVKNFIRKKNFSELNEALEDGEITDIEFDNELNKNEIKYAVKLENLRYPGDIDNIFYLMDKIGNDLREFSLSEVCEMFSIKESEILSHLRPQKIQIK